MWISDLIYVLERSTLLQVNQEPAYDTFLHRLPLPHLLSVKITGGAHISYVGFGTDGKPYSDLLIFLDGTSTSDLSPAPPVGFNVTFVCPPNHVFDFDWFAIPFIMMTCQDDGSFDQPDWDLYSCVLGFTNIGPFRDKIQWKFSFSLFWFAF